MPRLLNHARKVRDRPFVDDRQRSERAAAGSCPIENGAVTSAVLVHPSGGTGPLRLALTGATRSGSAGVGSLARDPLARLRRVRVESIGTAINFRPAAITNSRHRLASLLAPIR